MIEYVKPFNHHSQAVRTLQDHFGEREIVGIEIGCADAGLTRTLLAKLPNLKLIYTIDPYLFFPGTEFEASCHNQEWHDDRRKQAAGNLAEFPDRYVHLCVKSDDALSLTPDQVDFVWIDGDHTPTAIEKDVKNYYPKVKPGGLLGGHDWDRAIRIVLSNLDENVTLGKDLAWWLTKQSS